MAEPRFIQVSTITGLQIIAVDNIASVKQTPSGTEIILKEVNNGNNVVIQAQQSYGRIQQLINQPSED